MPNSRCGSVVRTGSHSSGKLKKPEPGKVTIWRGSLIEAETAEEIVAAWLLRERSAWSGSVRVSVTTPPVERDSRPSGRSHCPPAAGPISLRAALIAGEVGSSSKFCAVASPAPTGPTKSGFGVDRADVAREVAVVRGRDAGWPRC